MNKKALFWLFLLTDCDALVQSFTADYPTQCTQSSSQCPTGQVCDFSAALCQPIGGLNPPGWSIAMTTVSSCPQPAVITISGPASRTVPKVKLNTIDVDAAYPGGTGAGDPDVQSHRSTGNPE